MNQKYKCVFCSNVIVGGDFVTHDNEEIIHSHAFCYVKKSLEMSKKKGNLFFNLFGRNKHEIDTKK